MEINVKTEKNEIINIIYKDGKIVKNDDWLSDHKNKILEKKVMQHLILPKNAQIWDWLKS